MDSNRTVDDCFGHDVYLGGMKQFLIGQNSLEVSQVIVANHPALASINLIAAAVGMNWRQRNTNAASKLKHLQESFIHELPRQEKIYTRKQFLRLQLSQLEKLPKDQVWALCSKVRLANGAFAHIPMMNFHPEGVGIEAIKETIKQICPNRGGCILSTGRFFHYYGDFLLTQKQWQMFMAEFLMPCIVVSPRYIGHRLHDGYCTLRLTTQIPHKPTTAQSNRGLIKMKNDQTELSLSELTELILEQARKKGFRTLVLLRLY